MVYASSHVPMRRFIQTSTLICLMVAAALPGRAADAPRKPYVETIPGTLVKFEMVSIPGGTFAIVDPTKGGAARTVRVKPLWIGKTEVTWDEYDIYAFRLDQTEQQKAQGIDATSRPSRPYGAPDRGFGHHGYPALSMTFHAAEEYCRWLSGKTGKKYRLPTEAEWEYACRTGGGSGTGSAKTASNAGTGGSTDQLSSLAWIWENADDKTHPVGTKRPNAWGLYDMLGNVAEWCQGTDGTPVVRGGSYIDRAARVDCRTSARQTPAWDATDPQNPKSQWWLADAPFVGFRVVREE